MNWSLRIVLGLVGVGVVFLLVDRVQWTMRRGPYRFRA